MLDERSGGHGQRRPSDLADLADLSVPFVRSQKTGAQSQDVQPYDVPQSWLTVGQLWCA